MNDRLTNAVLGPFGDLRRMVLGALATPPSTRRFVQTELEAARGRLRAAGCLLDGLTCENLHTATVLMDAAAVYSLFKAWRAWPRSSFFPRQDVDHGGALLFSYRFYGVLPVVKMRLFHAEQPCHIIHAVEWGFGRGGYHAFLFAPAEQTGATEASIFTIYPPQPFLTGLHDQTNADIFRKLARLADER